MKKILIAEDNQSILKNLKEYLSREGFDVISTDSIKSAKEISLKDMDLVILDWMLPDGQGIDLVKEIKTQYKNLPIIMLTARVEITDKVLGLEMGADDYLTKPFDPRELVARIRVQLRKKEDHSSETGETIFQSGVSIEIQTRKVTYENREVRLNRMEFDLIKFLLLHPNTVFSRQELLDQVWGVDSFPTTRTVDQHILNLRNKLSSNLIETIRGVGYRLK